jgi:hypothetical protein
VRNFDLIDGAAKPSSGEQVADEVKLVRRLWPGSGVGFYHFPHFSAEQAGTLGSQVFGEAVANSWQSVDCEQC